MKSPAKIAEWGLGLNVQDHKISAVEIAKWGLGLRVQDSEEVRQQLSFIKRNDLPFEVRKVGCRGYLTQWIYYKV